MERKLASIQLIKSLEPIPGADSIEKATVLGWQLVVKKGEFQVNSPCVYLEIDSLVPERPEFEFLRSRNFRIKTIKLKKQVSQGIAFPLSILPECRQQGWIEGEDVTEVLGVTKYEIPIPAQLSGQIKGAFPGFLVKTDETRIQAAPEVLNRQRGKLFQITEKVDGTSMTVYFKDGEFGVCSRNLDLKETEDVAYWKAARAFDLENKLRSVGKNICIQGELVGPGIQGNKYKLTEMRLFVFNVFDIDNHQFYSFDEFHKFIADLGLNCVPLVWTSFELNHTIEDLVKMTNDHPSYLNDKTPREGLVFRPMEESQDEELGRLSFKVINPEFLLKYGE